MVYTQAEKEKIHANLDAIKAYIQREIQPNITDRVVVDFGNMKSYLNGDREKEYHLYVSPKSLSCRIGGLGFDFVNAGESSYSATAYTQLDYAVELIRDWQSIKSILNTAIQRENDTRNAINNFYI